MPRREDERHLNLTGGHPAYCTCTECTDRFLKKRGIRPTQSRWKRFFGRDKVKSHPNGCGCATCNLLRSVDQLPTVSPRKAGFLHRLLGKE